MMYTGAQVTALLDALNTKTADSLESQELDFKEWDTGSTRHAVSIVVQMAVCMANGGGGTVVFGIKDHAIGRANAIIGIPEYIDPDLLVKTVYESTDPKIGAIFEVLRVPEGTGRLLIMHVRQDMPLYTDTGGYGTRRVGKDCQPLTGTQRSLLSERRDITSELVPGSFEQHISQSALEELKKISTKEHAPTDLISLSDHDFLKSLGLVENNQLTIAGLLLIGKEASIKEYIPNYYWTHLQMKDDTDYTDKLEGRDPLIIALSKITDRIMANNPLTTIKYGMFQFEYRRYPEVVLREAMMNALSHADYHICSPIMVKQYPDRLEISNPGGFIGGITPRNILHHAPVARNPRLVEALTKLRLVNRSNLGISRMYKYMLVDGKEPPIIEQQGEIVKITLIGGELSPGFRAFVEKEYQAGRGFEVDHLLILNYLLSRREIGIKTAVALIQRTDTQARDILHAMEHTRGYLEHGGSGKSIYWSIHPSVHKDLELTGHPYGDRRIDWEAAKLHVLSVLKQQKNSPDNSLTNHEIRAITKLGREQVKRLMRELREQHPEIICEGERRLSKYYYKERRP